jgi:hypothetical protein
MRKFVVILVALVLGAIVVTGPAIAATKVITVKMSGKQESPKGDPDGSGTAKITLNSTKGSVCFELTWSKIGNPAAAHIHMGPKGKAGNVVIPLFGNPPAKHKGCVSAKKSLVAAILKSPGAYYVNVHTAKYPAGALRGQL